MTGTTSASVSKYVTGLEGLALGRYRITLRLTEPAVLPALPGITLRGALGTALKRLVCLFPRHVCQSCQVRDACVYARTFAGTEEREDLVSRGRATPARPFVIDPPLLTKRAFEANEEISFTVTLLGSACTYLPYFVCALTQLEMKGLGRARARFIVRSVIEETPQNITRELYDTQQRVLSPATPPARITQWIDFTRSYRPRVLRLRFLSPVRVKSQHRYQRHLPFEVFWNAVRRRIDDVFATHGSVPFSCDWSQLYYLAQQFDTLTEELQWVECERFSRSQGARMTLGGLVGTVSYRGPLGALMPWLKLGEMLHIGKNTTFGFGKYVILDRGTV